VDNSVRCAHSVPHLDDSEKMSEVYKEITTAFSTADTESPVELNFKANRLIARFLDWQRHEVQIEFSDVVALRWDDNYLPSITISPDRVYEVENSEWIAALQENGGLGSSEQHIHLKLGFNDEGKFLDVIATQMNEAPNKARDATE